jgi:hypothetical protein
LKDVIRTLNRRMDLWENNHFSSLVNPSVGGGL